MDVTVVIPTYNGKTRGYIGKAIRSVLGQTLAPKRLLVIDDGSSDGTAEALRAEFPGIEVASKPNGGLPSARNFATRLVTTRYVCFLDDDDEWVPEKLAVQNAFLAQHPDVDFLFCGVAFIDKDGNTLGARHPPAAGWTFPGILLGNSILPPSTVVFSRALLTRAGDFNEALRQGEDYDYFIRCAQHGKMAAQPELLVRYRQHNAQMSGNLRHIDDVTLAIIDGHAAQSLPERRAAVVRFFCQGAAIRALLRGDFAYARTALKRAGSGLTPIDGVDLIIRLLGIVLPSAGGAKLRWRAWEHRRVLGGP